MSHDRRNKRIYILTQCLLSTEVGGVSEKNQCLSHGKGENTGCSEIRLVMIKTHIRFSIIILCKRILISFISMSIQSTH